MNNKPHLFEILDWVKKHPMRNGRIVAVCLWGGAGVGKTTMTKEWALMRNMSSMLYLPAHNESGSDIRGLSYVNQTSGRTHYASPSSLPSKDEAEVHNPSGVLIIDEINRAEKTILNSLLELIGDGKISQSEYELPSGWQIVCTANPEEEGFDVTKMDNALKDRMLHIAVSFDPERFALWAEENGLEPDIIQFAIDNADIVSGGSPELPESVTPSPTPRAMEMMAALWDPDAPENLMRVIAEGLLGKEGATRFFAAKNGEARPLSGPLVLNGTWRRYLPRWLGDDEKRDLVRKSVASTILYLEENNQPTWQEAQEVVAFMTSLDKQDCVSMFRQIKTRSPSLISMIGSTDSDSLAKLEELLSESSAG